MATVTDAGSPALQTGHAARVAPVWFGVTVIWSACLLFLVEPLASKLILPWFGGSASVWITCLLFFQGALLAGYLYAHGLSRVTGPLGQAVVHSGLLLVSFVSLPVIPDARWQPKAGADPTWPLLWALATSVGLPYLLLSSTSPLVQSWFARVSGGSLPYRYFALSNAGSLAALLSYPVLIEPRLLTGMQAWSWSVLYVGFALCCIAAAWLTRHAPQAPLESVRRARRRRWLTWIALSACPSALLLATTTVLTENIAPMPLLWVLPLGIYLLTFILCFDSRRWYRRRVFLPALLPALGCLAGATGPLQEGALGVVAPLLLASFFVCCMACHGELVDTKPEAEDATAFYVALAIGGALGGLFVAILAPRLFPLMIDFPLLLVLCGVVLLIRRGEGRKFWRGPYSLPAWLFGWVAVVLLGGYLAGNLQHQLRHTVFAGRNFYGALRVEALNDNAHRPVFELMHGTITHGVQYREIGLRNTPTTYYTKDSGVGLIWRALQKRGPLKIGVVGLGAGTLAAYGRAGDRISFYEINPLVIDIARRRFTFLEDSPAHVEIHEGDARLTLQNEPAQGFDLLVVDAFTGDAIPVHLLTREALRLYSKHLRPNGVLAFHLSNRYLDLPPVVAATASAENLTSFLVENEDNDLQETYATAYVLSVRELSSLADPLLTKRAILLRPSGTYAPWTDSFSNLWRVLQLQENEVE